MQRRRRERLRQNLNTRRPRRTQQLQLSLAEIRLMVRVRARPLSSLAERLIVVVHELRLADGPKEDLVGRTRIVDEVRDFAHAEVVERTGLAVLGEVAGVVEERLDRV